MAGISSKASGGVENKRKFNEGTDLENKEFSDGSGLDLYATEFRSYDPQIGRFHQLDPLAEAADDWSPYVFAYDNPILFNDALGLAGDSTTKPNPDDPDPGSKLAEVKTLEEVVVVSDPKKSNPNTTNTAGLPATPLPNLYPIPGGGGKTAPAPIPVPGVVGTATLTVFATVMPLYGGLAPGVPYNSIDHLPHPFPEWPGHGNDRRNTNPHIVYYFTYDSKPGQSSILKYGISDYFRWAQTRPDRQLPRLRRLYGKSVYYTLYTRTTTREQALFIEKLMVTQHVNRWGYKPIEQDNPPPFTPPFEF